MNLLSTMFRSLPHTNSIQASSSQTHCRWSVHVVGLQRDHQNVLCFLSHSYTMHDKDIISPLVTHGSICRLFATHSPLKILIRQHKPISSRSTSTPGGGHITCTSASKMSTTLARNPDITTEEECGGYPEEVARFILCEEEAALTTRLPSFGHKPSQAPFRRVLQDECEVVMRQKCFFGVDNIDMPFTKISLNLQHDTLEDQRFHSICQDVLPNSSNQLAPLSRTSCFIMQHGTEHEHDWVKTTGPASVETLLLQISK
jgi:hypothetical protein